MIEKVGVQKSMDRDNMMVVKRVEGERLKGTSSFESQLK